MEYFETTNDYFGHRFVSNRTWLTTCHDWIDMPKWRCDEFVRKITIFYVFRTQISFWNMQSLMKCIYPYVITHCMLRYLVIVPDVCRGTPCSNGGSCLPDGWDFRCVCAGGWAGRTCSDIGMLKIYCLNHIYVHIFSGLSRFLSYTLSYS